jgi:hypothetical protein
MEKDEMCVWGDLTGMGEMRHAYKILIGNSQRKR